MNSTTYHSEQYSQDKISNKKKVVKFIQNCMYAVPLNCKAHLGVTHASWSERMRDIYYQHFLVPGHT